MSRLDERARRASSGVQRAVADANLQLLARGLAADPAARRPALATRALAFGGAFVLLLMAIGVAVVEVPMFASNEEPPLGTEPDPPVIFDQPEDTTPPSVTEPTPEPTTTPTTTVTTSAPEPEPAHQADTTPPLLAITDPADGELVENKVVVFSGVTEPDATVHRGKYPAEIDSEGHWTISLIVSPGSNHVTFVAVDPAGNESTAAVTVLYEPAAEEPPPEEPPEVGFSAFATFGSCEEIPPYDIYYGTAKPGTVVTISSEYGSGSAEVDAEGNWEAQVFFPSAPKDKSFTVTVKDYKGDKKKFSFVSKAEA